MQHSSMKAEDASASGLDVKITLDPLNALRATKLKHDVASKGKTANANATQPYKADILGEEFLSAVFSPSSRDVPSTSSPTRPPAGYSQQTSSSPTRLPAGYSQAAAIARSGDSQMPLPSQKHDGGHWHCALCRAPTVPLVGALAKPLLMGQGSRHHCRTCGRTVCASCSLVVNGLRTCSGCNLRDRITILPGSHPEKIIFFVRHAKSIWNEAMASGVSDVASASTSKDHGLSAVGLSQTEKLRQKVAQGFGERERAGSSWYSRGNAEHVHRYYNTFFEQSRVVYSSPLLRAIQTAHLSFPPEDGWGKIKLLKDARELYRFATERDCIGTTIGANIANRAELECTGMNGLRQRVDCNDCDDVWWSQVPESGEEIDMRQQSLWETLLQDDESPGCIVVTHSNMIRTLLARFGSAENNCDRCGLRSGQLCDRTLCRARNLKLDHCNVLGVRCVFGGVESLRGRTEERRVWVAQDALLMFDSQFVSKG